MNEVKRDSGFAVVSFIMGILSLFSVQGAVFGVVAIVFGILQNKRERRGMATAGIILGGGGIALFLIRAVIYVFAFLFGIILSMYY